jgi:hypothetical protein
MDERDGAAWRGRFLAALARCGNVRMSAQAAGVDHSTAYLARRRDRRFAESWAAALGEAQGRLAGDEAPSLAGAEVVRRSRHGRPCIAQVGPDRWSADKEAHFLAALEEGANVRRAARAARISTTALYTRRQREPAFAEAWEAAVRSGYLDVEALLIENAKAVLSDAPKPRRPESHERRLKDDMTVADAINILKLHRASVKGGAPQRYDWRAQEPDIEEVRAEILREVAAMERARR